MTTRPHTSRSTAQVVEAVKLEGGTPDVDGFSYTVLIDRKPLSKENNDRRDAARRRTRLRSGKIVDSCDGFITECLVHDLSESGMRLRLPTGVALPAVFQVYDDQSGRLQRAELSWRRADEAGIRFTASEDTPRSRTIAADMRRKFYKMPR